MRASGAFPSELTSYDFLKSFALLTMIVDHVGLYLFPEQQAWRIVGRMSLPVWMFLIGYARSRTLGVDLLSAAAILIVSDMLFGEALLPLSILVTIIIARLSIDRIMAVATEGWVSLVVVTGLIGVGLLPTTWLFEYGAPALLFSMLGYYARHRDELSISHNFIIAFALVVSTIHAMTQAYFFGVGIALSVLIWLLVTGVGLALTRFRASEYPGLKTRLGMPLVGAIMIMGRHTLIIYVLHLLLLKALAAWLVWDHDWLFSWTLM